jgi:hypothetical protein
MSEQHIDVTPGAITDGDTGAALLTRETADQETARWTAEHPPIPGLRWRISWGTDLQGRIHVRDRRLEVIPGWEDAFAPPVATRPTTAKQHAVVTRPAEADRLGALAYQGWFGALPDIVRENSSARWADLPEPFRAPLRAASVLVWQHGENAGFHEALLRTLPAGQLGAAGTLEDLADFVSGMARLHGLGYGVPAVLGEISRRVAGLRAEAKEGAKRARERDR